jgi:glycosyltransferase involved in cell wall biosynthesis
MKKILIVTTKFPFPLFSGDKLRIFNILKKLSKKNRVDLIYTDSKANLQKKIKFINKTIFVKTHIFEKYFNIIYFLIIGKPLQIGYFFSNEMKAKISEIKDDYDVIIFHLIRSAEYLPKNYKGKSILEITDLLSKNYLQLQKKLNIFNPLKYIYFLEQVLVKKYEKKIANFFNKIIFVSGNDSKYFFIGNKNKKKIQIITNGTDLKKKQYKFRTKNNDIIFIGNINYLPNKLACYDFIKKIMPKLEKEGLNITFKIIGQTSSTLKFFLTRYKNVEVHNNVLSIEKLCKNAVCGISNLSVATGVQNKIMEYMRIGLPTIVSEKCFDNLRFVKSKDLLVFKDESDFVKKIIKLKNQKMFARKISENCYRKIKKFYSWDKSLEKYNI